jgi:tetratricopeptide (TPR) repeat protein
MSLILALFAAQVGPLNTPGAAPPLPHERQTEVLRPPRSKIRSAPTTQPATASPTVSQGARAEAALAEGDFAGALAALDAAPPAADSVDRGRLAVLRARALVGLKRESEAEAPLAEARAATPGDASVWLLSATLSRRLNKLAEAQARIEKAAGLQPTDPEIALEAGLIAVLAGRDDAARKSWRSVIAVAPDSDAAATARGYLAQLDPQKDLSR